MLADMWKYGHRTGPFKLHTAIYDSWISKQGLWPVVLIIKCQERHLGSTAQGPEAC